MGNEAKILYKDGGFDILAKGDYVICAQSGKKILLVNLKYWSVNAQKPFFCAYEAYEFMSQETYNEDKDE